MTKTHLTEHCQEQLGELRSLARELTTEEWSAPTLCAGWQVKDVFAHLLYGRLHGPVVMAAGILRHRGSMNRWGDVVSRKLARELPVDELIAAFDRETSRWPERGIAGMEGDAPKLADNVTHELDIRWPLGRRRDMPPERMAAALGASTKTNMWGNSRRLKGLTFRATDVDWSMPGRSPEVAGPAEHLLLAINGRAAGLDGLEGPGVGVLRERIRA